MRLVEVINKHSCSIENIQKFIGTRDETNTETIIGRLKRLENLLLNGNINNIGCSVHDTWPGPEEWSGPISWDTETNTNNIKEW